MRYLTLLYDDEANGNEPGTPGFDAEVAGYMRFGEIAGEAIVAGEALEPAPTVRTVRPGASAATVTAGPFAETTEVLGGFYVLDADSLDDVIELARQIPAALTGAVEIRPLVQWVEATGDRASGGDERRWLCTIHGPETAGDDPADPAWAEGAAAHARFGERAGGALLAGAAVHTTQSATTIRVRDGELLVSDGPCAEGIEVVGGLYLLAGDEQGVAELAGHIPTNEGGAVEVRPIMEFDG